MPVITELRVSNCRNLSDICIHPSPRINFFYGKNGAGKTSLLESISLVAHGRSFRTRDAKRLIQKDKDHVLSHLKLVDDHLESARSLGVRRVRVGRPLIKVDGQQVSTVSTLASLLPLQVINADSFALLEGSSKVRRQLFDWLVFHVKHDFHSLWRDYVRAIKQRNSLLRHGKMHYSDFEHWDIQICRLAAKITRFRFECFDLFERQMNQLISESSLIQRGDWEVSYDPGYGRSVYLAEMSEANLVDYAIQCFVERFQRDKKLGYTTLGPHKADVLIRLDAHSAGEQLSRGQQKVLITAVHLACAKVFFQETKKKPVFLLDDLPSELDNTHLQQLSDWINATDCQVFLTGVDEESVRKVWSNTSISTNISTNANMTSIDSMNNPNCFMFHVEHGELTHKNLNEG